MKKNILFLLIATIIITSCERNVEVNIPEKPPVLVLNGLLQKGDTISVVVGKSRHILSPAISGNLSESYAVKNAIPVVFVNNIPVDTLKYLPAEYLYRSLKGTTIGSASAYTIKVMAPGFTPVEASAVLPSQSVIAEVKRTKNAKMNSSGAWMDEVTIKLDDPAGEKNYYLVQVFAAGTWYNNYPLYCVSTTDKDIELIGEDADPVSTDNCYDGGKLLLSDANFNGKQKVLNLFIESNELTDYVDGFGARKRPYIHVLRITEDYFKYIKSSAVYQNAVDNPFAEPVNVYSNVKNGFGIFSLSTMAVDSIR
jgi:hypothetical protein